MAQPARDETAAKSGPCRRIASLIAPAWLRTPLLASDAVGVGQPEEPLTETRRTDPRSAQIGGPDFISQCFQVSANSGEPRPASIRRNLLSKRDCRFAERHEVAEDGPEVAGIGFAEPKSGLTEWLAGAGASAHRLVVGPASETQSEWPASDAGEEVLLSVSGEIMGRDIDYAAFIHVPRWDFSRADQIAQPLGSLGIVFVVVSHRKEKTRPTRRQSGRFAPLDSVLGKPPSSRTAACVMRRAIPSPVSR